MSDPALARTPSGADGEPPAPPMRGPSEPQPLTVRPGRELPGWRWFRLRRLLVLTGVLLLVPLTLFSVRPFAEIPAAVVGIRAAAMALLALGLSLRAYAIGHIAGAKGHKLVTSGPYAMCRHPLYLGSLLGGMGVVLLSQAPLCWLLFLIGGVTTYAATMRFEERRLAENYPLTIAQYRAEVPLLIPQRLRLEAPERLPPGLPILKETATQAGFLAAALTMELLVWWAEHGELPAVLRLW